MHHTLNFLVLAIALSSFLSICNAFVAPHHTQLSYKKKNLSHYSSKNIHQDLNARSHNDVDEKRRDLLKKVTFSIATVVSTTSYPSLVHAEGQNKIATTSALRVIKKSMKELKNMEFYAIDNDYVNVKNALRVPPFTECELNEFFFSNSLLFKTKLNC